MSHSFTRSKIRPAKYKHSKLYLFTCNTCGLKVISSKKNLVNGKFVYGKCTYIYPPTWSEERKLIADICSSNNEKLKGEHYQLRDGKDGRDFIFDSVVDIQGIRYVKCKISKSIGKKPTQDHLIDLEHFNKYSYKYGDYSIYKHKNLFTHDWDHDWCTLTGSQYPFLTKCKKCGIQTYQFQANHLSCDEMIVKDIII